MKRIAQGMIETLVVLFLSGLIFYIAFSGIDSTIRNYTRIKNSYLRKLNMESALQIYLSGRKPPETINGQKINFSEENLIIKLQEGE